MKKQLSNTQDFPSINSVKPTPENFPGYEIRQPVPEVLSSWSSVFPSYNPPLYTSKIILDKTAQRDKVDPAIAADPFYVEPAEISARFSFAAPLQFAEQIDHQGQSRLYPLNPLGRTGIRGRGACKKWGPIQAADSILTRFNSSSQLMELLVIRRRDNHQFAFPGGKVDQNESHTRAALRELFEEALSFSTTETDQIPQPILPDHRRPPFYFYNSEAVFEGVHRDPRNTDNAWYEGRAYHKHLDNQTADKLILRAGSDASEVNWMSLTPQNIDQLFGDHPQILRHTLARMNKLAPAALSADVRQAIIFALGDQSLTELRNSKKLAGL